MKSLLQKLDKFRDKLTNLILNYPKQSILINFLLLALFAPGLFMLTSDFTHRVWYDKNDPLMEVYRLFEKRFGSDESFTFSVQIDDDKLFSKEGLKLLKNIEEDLWQVTEVQRVESILNFPRIKTYNTDGYDEIEIAPLIPDSIEEIKNLGPQKLNEIKRYALNEKDLVGELLSNKGNVVLFFNQLRPSFEDVIDYDGIQDGIEKIKEKYKDHSLSPTLNAAGPIMINRAFKESSGNDMATLLPLLYLLFTFVLIYLYRNPVTTIIPHLIITTSIAMMMGMNGYFGLEINSLTTVCPTVLFTIAVADSIHILTVYFLGLKNNMSKEDAIRYSMKKNFYPTLLTTITTSIGFLSFATAKIIAVANLGVSVGIGVVFAWLCTYLLIPPLLLIFHKPKNLQSNIPDTPKDSDVPEIQISKRAKDFSNFVISHSKKFIFLFVAILISALYSASHLKVNMNPYEQFRDDHFINTSTNYIEKTFWANWHI